MYCIYRCTSTPCAKDENANCFYKPTTDRHSGFPAPVISARISTKKTFSFTYGRIEVFAKLPLGAWLFPCKYCLTILLVN